MIYKINLQKMLHFYFHIKILIIASLIYFLVSYYYHQLQAGCSWPIHYYYQKTLTSLSEHVQASNQKSDKMFANVRAAAANDRAAADKDRAAADKARAANQDATNTARAEDTAYFTQLFNQLSNQSPSIPSSDASDNTSVASQDSSTNSQEMYLLSQIPQEVTPAPLKSPITRSSSSCPTPFEVISKV